MYEEYTGIYVYICMARKREREREREKEREEEYNASQKEQALGCSEAKETAIRVS